MHTDMGTEGAAMLSSIVPTLIQVAAGTLKGAKSVYYDTPPAGYQSYDDSCYYVNSLINLFRTCLYTDPSRPESSLLDNA